MKLELYIYFIIAILLFIIIYNVFSYKTIETFDANTAEIVISRYNEDLEWLKNKPFNKYSYIVYNKGVNNNFYKSDKCKNIINLDNVGREGHTYLYHIINNYDNLSDITIFLPGSTSMDKVIEIPNTSLSDTKINKATKLINKIEETNNAVILFNEKHNNIKDYFYDFKINDYGSTFKDNRELNHESLVLSQIRPYGKWFENVFGDITPQHVSYFGIISISKTDILQKQKSYYEKLIKHLDNCSNPETGHYFERSWEAVFYPMNNTLFYSR
jgi:hypothetical protein